MKRFPAFALLALVLGLGAFAGAAGAGNGNDGSAPGNSANAPGQEKQAADQQQAAPQPTKQPPAQQSSSTPPGQAKKSSGSGQHGSPSQGLNATSAPGVKPANNTKKNTLCSTGSSAPSCSGTNGSCSSTKTDCSKRYGNGKTAAGIAQSRGAPGGTKIYGPGNSQPHKVWDCRKQHWVDVHSVKSYSSLSCQSTTTTSAPATKTSTSTTGTTLSLTPATGSTSGGTAIGAGVLGAGASSPAAGTGGVLGAQVTIAQPASHASSPANHGVLGAVATVASGTLPFTGLQVWIAVLVAAALIAAGVLVRRRLGGTSRA